MKYQYFPGVAPPSSQAGENVVARFNQLPGGAYLDFIYIAIASQNGSSVGALRKLYFQLDDSTGACVVDGLVTLVNNGSIVVGNTTYDIVWNGALQVKKHIYAPSSQYALVMNPPSDIILPGLFNAPGLNGSVFTGMSAAVIVDKVGV